MNENGMVILQLQINNIGPIKEADIVLPPSGVIVFGGKNDVGKTQTLLAIRYLLGGVSRGQDSPLRRGEKKGEIIAYLGESKNGLEIVDGRVKEYKYKLRRLFTEKGTSIEVRPPERIENGIKIKNKYESPQTLLDQFLSDLAFDPLEFIKMDDKKQTEALLKVAPIPFDKEEFEEICQAIVKENSSPLDTINATYKELYADRTELNRALDRAKKVLETIEIPEEVEEIQIISVSELFEKRHKLEEEDSYQSMEIDKLQELNNKANTNRKEKELFVNVSNSKITMNNNQIKRLQEEIDRLTNEATQELEKQKVESIQFDHEYEEIQKYIKYAQDEISTFTSVDFTEIDQKIKDADKLNEQAREAAEKRRDREIAIENKRKAEADVFSLEVDAKSLTDRLNAILDYKQALLTKVQFPVDGLGFDDEGRVTYENMPLKVRGQSVQLITSCAITAALKPSLKVILSPSETQLDSEHREQLEKWAKDNGYQILTCRVVEQREPGVSFFIEDGVIG